MEEQMEEQMTQEKTELVEAEKNESAEDAAEEVASPVFDADAYLEQIAEAKRSVTAGIVIYKGRINEKLQERTAEGYDAVAAIVNEPQYDRLAQYDAELAAFKSTGTIYQMESGTGEKTLYDRIEYIDDYRILYEQMMFFFRRMLFGLDYSDCMLWLREWGLTVHFVIQLLLESELGEKGKVAVILAGLYDTEGFKKEAVYLLNVMLEHCSGEERTYLSEKLRMLQEERETDVNE